MKILTPMFLNPFGKNVLFARIKYIKSDVTNYIIFFSDCLWVFYKVLEELENN
jgi:hypothetical protein